MTTSAAMAADRPSTIQAAADAISGVEGLSRDSVMETVEGAVIAGTVYSAAGLERCLDAEKKSGGAAVCAARLSSAAAAVQPQSAWPPRASLDVENAIDTTRVTIRFGDVPVFRASSPDRPRLLGWSSAFAMRLNRVAEAVRRDVKSGKPYPVAIRALVHDGVCEIRANWNFDQGRNGDAVASVPLSDIEEVSRTSNVDSARLTAWWAALLQDALRAYILAERPLRTATAKPSPLAAVYDNALRLDRKLDADAAGPALARGYFGLQLSTGGDPLRDVLTSVPTDFTVKRAQ